MWNSVSEWNLELRKLSYKACVEFAKNLKFRSESRDTAEDCIYVNIKSCLWLIIPWCGSSSFFLFYV